jgi:hypothetical protein
MTIPITNIAILAETASGLPTTGYELAGLMAILAFLAFVFWLIFRKGIMICAKT